MKAQEIILENFEECLNVWPTWDRFAETGCYIVYLLISGFGDEHSIRATSFRNASRKEPDPPFFDLATSQLLDESWLIKNLV